MKLPHFFFCFSWKRKNNKIPLDLDCYLLDEQNAVIAIMQAMSIPTQDIACN